MTDAASFTLRLGSQPLLVSLPHVGTEIPADLQAGFVPRALQTEDTDWHLERLYDFLDAVGASVIVPRFARYVIDLNRPPNDTPMYPGAANTELCPTRFFTGEPLYQPGCEPDMAQRLQRRTQYWQPYHDALVHELARIKAVFGYALLWDAHSIRSEVPWLFEGRLPDLNIGTADGASAHPRIAQEALDACSDWPQRSTALNGRFKGGYITRHYGQPNSDIHAVQLEMCQSLYMQEVSPFGYDVQRAAQIQPLLHKMVASSLQACRSCYEK